MRGLTARALEQVLHTAAPLDPDCRAVVLAAPTSAAVFTLMPRYKAQSVGSAVYYQNRCLVESVGMPHNHLHASHRAYHPAPDPYDYTLPKALRHAPVYEVSQEANPREDGGGGAPVGLRRSRDKRGLLRRKPRSGTKDRGLMLGALAGPQRGCTTKAAPSCYK